MNMVKANTEENQNGKSKEFRKMKKQNETLPKPQCRKSKPVSKRELYAKRVRVQEEKKTETFESIGGTRV